MANKRAVLTVAVCLTMGLTLVGCSGSATSSASTSAAASASSAAPTSASPASSAAASAAPTTPASAAGSSAASAAPSASGSESVQQQWCSAYSTITGVLGQAGTTKDDAQKSLKVLESFDQLWVAGGNLGYITADESDANRRAVASYATLVALIAQGKATDSNEVKTARTNLTAVTDKDKALLTSSSSKVTALCGLRGAGAPASAAPSPAAS